MLARNPKLLKLPATLDFRDDSRYEQQQNPSANRNRGGTIIHAYAAARGVDPYSTPRSDIIAAISADLASLNT